MIAGWIKQDLASSRETLLHKLLLFLNGVQNPRLRTIHSRFQNLSDITELFIWLSFALFDFHY